ncbi:MAG: tetraacyldisaccharide 4'-kinase [Saccharospirillaceae bacterium]|nr:tetraacyldisaccharide 4'-kinase [Pseudomonadales bacterium]NRB77903.1 tetraacyldisaccharide 4'-kinase [Saccharospirillaceae bacterium]
MKIWQNKNIVAILLLPFSLLYIVLSAIDIFIKKNKGNKQILSTSPKIVVVGNITAGGTGKTPFIQMLAKYLISQNKKVGIVTRGYGAFPPNEPFLVTNQSNSVESGDEALMHAQSLNVPVVIAKQRNLAVAYLKNNYDLDVILSDDGLQHWQMPRHLNIVLLDGLRGTQNGFYLPAGPLRQSTKFLKKADYVYCKGEKQHTSLQKQWPSFNINVIGFFDKENKEIDIQNLNRLTLVSAIANPDSFYQVVKKHKNDFNTKEFLDHHAFSLSDFDDVKGQILMTQKDFVKCQHFKALDIYYCKIEVFLEDKELAKIYHSLFG